MVFSTVFFIFGFLVVTLFVYYLVPKRFKNIVLLIFNIIFYSWGEIKYAWLIFFSSIVDYTIGLLIEKSNTKTKKKVWLICSIATNLGLLMVFKYSNFIITNLNNLVGTNFNAINLTLPLGISFYTFQTMSYSMDVYMGNVKPEKNFFNFMTYVSLFPQLIAGPIVRYEEVDRELKERSITIDDVAIGMKKFIEGLFFKVFIANNVGFMVDSIKQTITVDSFGNVSVILLWFVIIAYAFQIYFDFYGYSVMAIGLGRMLGFKFPDNFNYPYISKSITEFWRRWHMTLSGWFRDYVYIPLGGSRCSTLKNIRNIFIVWALTGIWHGAEWNFVVWGIYFGVILILEKFVLNKILNKAPNFFKHMYAIFFILIGWEIFAFDNFTIMKNVLMALFGLKNLPLINDYSMYYIISYMVLMIIATILSTPLLSKIKEKIEKFVYEVNVKNKTLRMIYEIGIVLMYLAMFIVVLSFLVADSYNPFLYFRF